VTSDVNGGVRQLPMGELLNRFRSQFSELASAEMESLRSEIGEKRRRAVSAVVLGTVALIVALCAIGALVATAILALDLVLPAWAAALIVGGALLAAAVVALMGARAQLRKAGTPLPRKTIDNVKEDVTWLTTRARSGLS